MQSGIIERTPLELAAFGGYLAHVQNLLAENREAVNERGCDQSTPLMWASRRGHAAIVRELLDAGADPTAVNDKNETAADLAASVSAGHHEIVAMLEIKRLENYTLKRDLAKKRFTGSFFGCSKTTKLKWANTAITIIKEFLALKGANQLPRELSLSMYLQDNQHRLNARALKQGELGELFSSILHRDSHSIQASIKVAR